MSGSESSSESGSESGSAKAARRPKIVFIGAGSTVFAKNLLGDIFGYPELASAEIALYDIDAQRLRTSEVVAHRVARAVGASPTIVATTDRDRALEAADYVITMIQVTNRAR
jgi:alpha-galactosidase